MRRTWKFFYNLIIQRFDSAKNVSPQLRREYPDIPWKATAGMRDKIMHHYFGVDYEAVFATIRGDLPVLKTGITAILSVADAKDLPEKQGSKKKRAS